MIVMIDHLAFATERAEQDLNAFRELGYEAAFAEKDLRDLDNKRPFMEHFSGRVDMTLLQRQGSLSVELLNHGHVVHEGSYLHPVLDGVAHDLERLDDSLVLSDITFVKVRSEKLQAAFFVQEDLVSSEFNCTKVIVDADDIEQSAAFWQNLGFKPAAVEDRVTQLTFRALVGGAACDLYLRKRPDGTTRHRLDDQGFNCIALFSSNAEKDRQKFHRLGMEPTDTEPFHVGGKDLAIFWLRGPGGEIVEVIGLARS